MTNTSHFFFRPLSGNSADDSWFLNTAFHSQHKNIWHRYMTHTSPPRPAPPPPPPRLLFGSWKLYSSRQADPVIFSSPPVEPPLSPLLLTNPKLLSMVSSWSWRGGSPGRGGTLTWLQAPTHTPSKEPCSTPSTSTLLPTPSLFV